MEPTRRQLLAAGTTTIALAGCLDAGGGDGDGGGGDDGGGTDDGAQQTDADDGADDPTVQVREHDEHGEVLVGSEGLSLYNFDNDTQGESQSACEGGCLENWPPLTVEGEPVAGDAVEAELTTFERENGDTQVAADGWPLYYFAQDEAPGDANGHGANDVWWLLRPDGTVIRPDDGGGTDTGDDGGDGGQDSTETEDGGGDDGGYDY